MASAAKIAANIANAQKSTGPVTEQGRATSSRNAFKHGLASANCYIPANLQPLYDEITSDLNEAIQPQGTLEDEAFSELRNARFQMERIRILQSELGQESAARGLDPLKDPAVQKQWDRLDRYLRSAQSTFRANKKELRTLQSQRAVTTQLFRKEQPPASLTDYRTVFAIGRKRMKLGRFEANYLLGRFANPIPATEITAAAPTSGFSAPASQRQ